MEHSVVTLFGTGPRDWNPAHYDSFKHILEVFVQDRFTEDEEIVHIISGGAQGFDIALAMAAHQLSIPFSFILPNPTYVDYYYHGKGYQPHNLGKPETMKFLMDVAVDTAYASKTLYVQRNNRSIHSNFVRNDVMIERSDVCVAGFDSTGRVPMTGGTGYTVRAALAAGLDVYNQQFVLAERPMTANAQSPDPIPF